MAGSTQRVATRALKDAVEGLETRVLDASGVPYRNGSPHIRCPYPDHADNDASWRWDEKAKRARCTCTKGDGIVDVVMKVRGVDFEAAKLWIAGALDRGDLIRDGGQSFQSTDAESLLSPAAENRDDGLVAAYLAFRLGIAVDRVPAPRTSVAGIKRAPYFDPPPVGSRRKPSLVGHFPCAVFGTERADGCRHAHRIYLAAEGAGKAQLGDGPDGRPRDPKKSARTSGGSTAGCAVTWGEIASAPHVVLTEGIETGAAVALALSRELAAGELAVAACISAVGVEAWQRYPATRRMTVAADRDEAPKINGKPGSRRGENAARAFGLKHYPQLEIGIALPGQPGETVDWLDVLRASNVAAVSAGVLAPVRFVPTDEELAKQDEAADVDPRPVIKMGDAWINETVAKCVELTKGDLFMRGSVLAALTRVEAVGHASTDNEAEPGIEISGVRYARGSALFIEPTNALIQYRLDNRARFQRFSKREGWYDACCDAAIPARMIGAAAELGYRQCGGIASVPIFRDGRIEATPGLHVGLGVYLDLHGESLSIADNPTREDAQRELTVALAPFAGYLDGLPNDKAEPLRCGIAAGVMTSVLRPSLPAAPAKLIDANVPGAGKGKMARAFGVIGTGRLPAIITEGHSEEETEKRLAAAILGGNGAILLDNLQRTLASSTLESGLTEGQATIRRFGTLIDTTVPCQALVIITANNAALRADMLRRTLPIRIVVDTDRPEQRQFAFDPYEHAKGNRATIITAVLTIARAWWLVRDTDEGRRIRRTTLGSFEQWADLVAGAVEWLVGMNPISLIEARKAEDPRIGDERRAFAALWDRFGANQFQARDIVHAMGRELLAAEKDANAETPLLDALGAVVPAKGKAPNASTLGYWLRKRRDKVLDGRQLSCRIDRKGIAIWRLSGLQAPGMQGTAGHSYPVDPPQHPMRENAKEEKTEKTEKKDGQELRGNIPGDARHPRQNGHAWEAAL